MLINSHNCISTSLYNYMNNINKVPPIFEMLCFNKEYFQLVNYQGFLTIFSPLYIAEEYIKKIEAKVVFPKFNALEDAIEYLDDHLVSKGGIPVSVNLRYSVLYPLQFDNDFYHFHWIIRRNEKNEFDMFDQYSEGYYSFDVASLRKFIDCRFNYRDYPAFTPFMTVEIPDPARTKELIAQNSNVLEAFKSAVDNYPLYDNIEIGLKSIRNMRRFTSTRIDQVTNYFILNYCLAIVRTRKHAIDFLRHGMKIQDERLAALDAKWVRYREQMGMALLRGSLAEFDQLETIFQELIRFECDTMQSVLEKCLVAV